MKVIFAKTKGRNLEIIQLFGEMEDKNLFLADMRDKVNICVPQNENSFLAPFYCLSRLCQWNFTH